MVEMKIVCVGSGRRFHTGTQFQRKTAEKLMAAVNSGLLRFFLYLKLRKLY